MRNLLLFIGVISFLSACNSSKDPKENRVEAPERADTTTQITAQLTMPTGLTFKKFKLKAENCDMPSAEADDMEVDQDWCNTREINGLKVSMKDAAVAQKINALIEKEITGSNRTLKQFVAEIKNTSNEAGEL